MTETARSVFDQDQQSEDERLYFGMIDRAIEAREYRIISNGRPAHAVYLIYKMFEAAQREVKIYTGKLAQTLNGVLAYADPVICETAVAFLRRGGRLAVLVEDELDRSGDPHPFVDSITQAGLRDRLYLGRRSGGVHPWTHHFLLMDGEAVRVETDADKAEALVNLNDPKVGNNLGALFDLWREDAQTIPEGKATPA